MLSATKSEFVPQLLGNAAPPQRPDAAAGVQPDA